MNTVREEYTTIVGVDTHARTHTYALLEAASGRVVDTATFPTSPPGLARAIAWIDRRRAPGRTLVAIEGTISYGATLTRSLAATDLEVCQLRPSRRASRAGRGTSDDIDALAYYPHGARRRRLGPATAPGGRQPAGPCGSCSMPAMPWKATARPIGCASPHCSAPWIWALMPAQPSPTPRSLRSVGGEPTPAMTCPPVLPVLRRRGWPRPSRTSRPCWRRTGSS